MAKLGYIRGFDGLRAIAVTLVFIMHKTWFGNEIRLGFYGVWLFFLLSGFLINAQLHHSRHLIEQKNSTPKAELLSFWRRRFLRIFPAYYFALCATVAWYLWSGKSLDGIAYHFGYATNIYFEYVAPEMTSVFVHYWSLAVEEQFYLLFAPAVLLIRSVRMQSALVALLVLSLVARFALTARGIEELKIYIDSAVNFGIIALGGILYLKRDVICRYVGATSNLSALFLILLLLSVLLIHAVPVDAVYVRQLLFLGSLSMGALLVATVYAGRDSAFVSILEWRPLRFYGRLSYGFYLYQSYVPENIPAKLVSVLTNRSPAFAKLALSLEQSSPVLLQGTLQITGLVVCFAICFAVTYASWKLIEQPALRLRHSRRLTEPSQEQYAVSQPSGSAVPLAVESGVLPKRRVR